jgi:hypothetical protein
MNRLALAIAAAPGKMPAKTGTQVDSHHATHHRRPLSARQNGDASKDATERRETAALNRLEAAGYHNPGDIKPDGTMFRTTATKDGRQTTVLVDPDQEGVKPAR